jgi:hypothetical protein
MSFTGNEGGTIDKAVAAALTKNYRDAKPAGATKGIFIGKVNIERLLTGTSKGIRFYFGQGTDGSPELILVGADENEDDLLDCIVDNGIRCPPRCGSNNVLNSDMQEKL